MRQVVGGMAPRHGLEQASGSSAGFEQWAIAQFSPNSLALTFALNPFALLLQGGIDTDASLHFFRPWFRLRLVPHLSKAQSLKSTTFHLGLRGGGF